MCEASKTSNAPSSWLEKAAALPLAFAQVREDPLVDLWVVQQLANDARVIMIASGGCTAALLSTVPNIARLHLVDSNPAQLALSRLKLQLLRTAPSSTRLALMGHTPMSAAERAAQLDKALTALDLSVDVLGPKEFVARVGPDHAGRYERLFAQLQKTLGRDMDELQSLLQMNNPTGQLRRVASTTELGRHLDEALDTVMALSNLVRLFGEEATKNPAESFSRHFARRLRHVLGALPACHNPYLWQMLTGTYPDAGGSPWLTEPAPARMPNIMWSMRCMGEALEAAPASYDFVHLSNILDWLSPEEARARKRGQACRIAEHDSRIGCFELPFRRSSVGVEREKIKKVGKQSSRSAR